MYKDELLQKIGNYNDFETLKKDFLMSIKNSNIIGLNIDYENNEIFKSTLEELEYEFEKQNTNVGGKKEAIEQKLDVDLEELFLIHGINEFKISDTKSSVTYEKDGIPHVLIHTDPNTNIYEMVLRGLEFDKLNSKEDLDIEIEKSFDSEKDIFTNYDTNDTSKIENDDMVEITNYIRYHYGIDKIYDVKSTNDATIGESLLMDYGNGWQLLTIERDENGVIVSVNLGDKKNIDNEKNVTTGVEDIKTSNIEEELSKKAKENQFKKILIKLYNDAELSQDDKLVIDKFSDDSYFNTLPSESKEIFLQIIDIYKKPEVNSVIYDKVYKIEKKDKKEGMSAFVELATLSFLGGLASGMVVNMILKIFV